MSSCFAFLFWQDYMNICSSLLSDFFFHVMTQKLFLMIQLVVKMCTTS